MFGMQTSEKKMEMFVVFVYVPVHTHQRLVKVKVDDRRNHFNAAEEMDKRVECTNI